MDLTASPIGGESSASAQGAFREFREESSALAAGALKAEELPLSELRGCILDGTGPFSDWQYQRLYERAEAQLTIATRIDGVERAIDGSCEANRKFDSLLQGVFGKIASLQTEVVEERHVRERLAKAVQEEAKTTKEVQDARLGRCEADARGAAQSLANLVSEVNEGKAATARLTAEADEACAQRRSLDQRCTQLERLAADLLEKLKAMGEQFHQRLLGERLSRDSLLEAMNVSNREDFTTRDQNISTAMKRIEDVEGQLGLSLQKQGRELTQVRADLEGLRERFAEEQRQRDAQHRSRQDALAARTETYGTVHNNFKERIDDLERMLQEMAAKHAQDLAQEAAAHRTQIEHVLDRLQEEKETQQAHRSSCREQFAGVRGDVLDLQGTLQTAKAQLEAKVSEVGESCGKTFRELDAKRATRVKRNQEEFETRDQQLSRIGDRIARLEDLTARTADAAEKLQGRADGLQKQVFEVSDKERQQRESLQETFNDQLRKEKARRESAQASLQEQVTQCGDDVRTESGKRAQLQLLTKSLQDQLGEDRKTREAAEAAILEQLALARVAQQRQGEEVQERFVAMQEAQEASQAANQQNLVSRVEPVQRAVNNCHELIRQEIASWAAETKQVWKAIGALKDTAAVQSLYDSRDLRELAAESRLPSFPASPGLGAPAPHGPGLRQPMPPVLGAAPTPLRRGDWEFR